VVLKGLSFSCFDCGALKSSHWFLAPSLLRTGGGRKVRAEREPRTWLVAAVRRCTTFVSVLNALTEVVWVVAGPSPAFKGSDHGVVMGI
jgi:hypothetical protein